MRILIYGLNFAPELTGIGKYTGEMAFWLAERGHDVHVVTAVPYYPAWKIGEGFRNRYLRETRGGLKIWRCPLYVPQNPTGLKRVLHLLSFALASSLPMLRETWWEPEVVFTVEPTFFGAPVALLLGVSAGAATWLHVQDFEVDAAFELGLLPAEGPIHAFALWAEEVLTDAFTRISSISEKMVERAVVKGSTPEKVVLFPNWVDTEAVHPAEEERRGNNPVRRDLRDGVLGAAAVPGVDGKVLLLYSGNMGAKQGLELLPALARAMAGDERVHFVFCGDGSFRPRLQEMVLGMNNVTMLPLQAPERLNDLLNAADIHLLPQRAGAADLVMPSKLTGMLASGRPVIATADRGTQVAEVIEGDGARGDDGPGENACGLVVPAEDEAALERAVLRLVADREMRRRMGAAGRRYAVEHLGREKVLEQFERHLYQLVGNGRTTS